MGPALAQMLGSEALSNLDPGFGQTLELGFRIIWGGGALEISKDDPESRPID